MEIYLQIVSLQIAVLAPVLFVTIYNFWSRRQIDLPTAKHDNFDQPRLSILIPARNEEANIQDCIAPLLVEGLKNIEIIVLDDNSTDNTFQILEQLTAEAKSKNSATLKIIKGKPLPDKWRGKNWACHQLSQVATSDYLLFIDADVRLNLNAVSRAIHYLLTNGLGLLSIFPQQITKTWGEKLSVSYLGWLLVSFLPLVVSNRLSLSSLSAANGQFMLFTREAYVKIGGHEAVAEEVIEDIVLARRAKSAGIKSRILIGDKDISCRMYQNLQQSALGLAKNINGIMPFPLSIYFFIINIFVVLGSVLALLVSPLFLFVVAMILVQRLISAKILNQGMMEALITIFPQAVLLTFIHIMSVSNNFGRGFTWKQRDI